MDKEVKRIVKLAKRQNWRVEQGAKHIKLFDQNGVYRHGLSCKIPEGNYRLIRNTEADLRRAGFKFEDELSRLKEKPVVSVTDLIKLNAEGAKITQPPEPAPQKKKQARTSRKGLAESIMVVVRAHYPNDVDVTTLKMKVTLQHPGVHFSLIYTALRQLVDKGYIRKTRMGFYKFTGQETPVIAAPPPPPPQNKLDVDLPADYQRVIDNLVNAVAEAEKLMKELHTRAALAEKFKRMLKDL